MRDTSCAAGVDTFVLLLLERLGVRKLEAFFGVLVATMAAAFGVIYVRSHCPQLEVLRGVVEPRLRCVECMLAALAQTSMHVQWTPE